MRIAVVGGAGRLGAAVSAELTAAGHTVVPLGRADLDVTDGVRTRRRLARLQPDAIVNCSAYNAVDAAEADAETAYAVNAHGPSLLAAAADASGALLVHFSTDFVFDGRAREPYSEDDPTNPLSVYGASKLAGEEEVRRAPRHYILRLESLFGGRGRHGHTSTIDAIANTLVAGNVARALVDRTVSPSYVPDVARATRRLLDGNAPSGTYHCVNSGSASWYELAHVVAWTLGVPPRIEPVGVADLKTIAERPQFCALSNRKLLSLGIDMPTWQAAIGRHLSTRVEPVHALSVSHVSPAR